MEAGRVAPERRTGPVAESPSSAMRFRSGWRTCALVLLWFGMLVAPVAFVLGLCSRAPAYFELFRLPLVSLPPVWLSVVSIPYFLLDLWQYRVLTRREIRTLFLRASDRAVQPGGVATAPQGLHG